MGRNAMKRALITAVLSVGLIVLSGPWSVAIADDDDDDNDHRLQAVPFAFVGKVADCGYSGSNIVTSAWLGGMGLPDNGGANTTAADVTTNPNKQDPHLGLLLSKNGPQADCSAAGATITGVTGKTVTAGFTVGFDYRNGGHCGAGAPRFNIDTDMGFFFVGCANAPTTPAPQDPTEWSRTRSDVTNCGSECFPGSIPVGAKINSINIIFDEGTDIASNDTQGVGLAVVDNIDINGRLITRGTGIADGIDRYKKKHDRD